MDREDIIEMARKAGFRTYTFEASTLSDLPERLTKFAELVEQRTHTNNKSRWYQEGVEAEREACAKVCEQLGASTNGTYERNIECAAAIRARGNG
jgi:hypothetical protein